MAPPSGSSIGDSHLPCTPPQFFSILYMKMDGRVLFHLLLNIKFNVRLHGVEENFEDEFPTITEQLGGASAS